MGHFQGLPIRDLTPFAKNEEKADFEERPRTFASLKTRVVNLIIKALQVENESINTQFLLGGLMFVVQDSTALETSESETSSSPDSPDDASSTNNLNDSNNSTNNTTEGGDGGGSVKIRVSSPTHETP